MFNNKIFFKLFTFLLLFSSLNAADYTKYVEDITQRFDNAHELYSSGDKDEAKSVISSAYFEVFENMEGPIRINISAKKAYLMEHQFTDLRKMVKADKPADELKKAMDNLVAEMYEVLPEINGGVVLVAQRAEYTQEESTKEINPTWQSTLAYIQKDLDDALSVYNINNSKQTRLLIQDAQFEGYRNSAIEIAIRKNISSTKEREMQKRFTSLIRFIHTKPSKDLVKEHMDTLMASLKELAAGLPLVAEAKVIEVKEAKKDYSLAVNKIYSEFETAFSLHKKSHFKEAVETIQNSYFDIFEESGMEAEIGAKDATLKAELESHFSKLAALVKKENPEEDIQKEFSQMKLLFTDALGILDKKNRSFITFLIYSLTIMLREGFEALLIITAIIAYLIKSGNEEKLNIVYSSLISAIVLSFITAYGMNILFGSATAQNREILEGAVMLVACLLLLYVSYWLISNASAKKWSNYIQSQVKESLDSHSLKALWFTVFLAVYREGAETVLFYQALMSDASSSSDYLALFAGFILGVVLLFILYFIMKFTAIKLPIKPFFLFTGLLIFFMAFTFAGQGIMEFVEAKVIDPTLIQGMPTITFLGIYPYWESLIPQFIILFLGFIVLPYIYKNTVQ